MSDDRDAGDRFRRGVAGAARRAAPEARRRPRAPSTGSPPAPPPPDGQVRQRKYVFDTPDGRDLLDLFDGRDQWSSTNSWTAAPTTTARAAPLHQQRRRPPQRSPSRRHLGDGVEHAARADRGVQGAHGLGRCRSCRRTARRFADDCGAGGGFMLTVFLRDGDDGLPHLQHDRLAASTGCCSQQHPRPDAVRTPGGLGGTRRPAGRSIRRTGSRYRVRTGSEMREQFPSHRRDGRPDQEQAP